MILTCKYGSRLFQLAPMTFETRNRVVVGVPWRCKNETTSVMGFSKKTNSIVAETKRTMQVDDFDKSLALVVDNNVIQRGTS